MFTPVTKNMENEHVHVSTVDSIVIEDQKDPSIPTFMSLLHNMFQYQQSLKNAHKMHIGSVLSTDGILPSRYLSHLHPVNSSASSPPQERETAIGSLPLRAIFDCLLRETILQVCVSSLSIELAFDGKISSQNSRVKTPLEAVTCDIGYIHAYTQTESLSICTGIYANLVTLFQQQLVDAMRNETYVANSPIPMVEPSRKPESTRVPAVSATMESSPMLR